MIQIHSSEFQEPVRRECMEAYGRLWPEYAGKAAGWDRKAKAMTGIGAVLLILGLCGFVSSIGKGVGCVPASGLYLMLFLPLCAVLILPLLAAGAWFRSNWDLEFYRRVTAAPDALPVVSEVDESGVRICKGEASKHWAPSALKGAEEGALGVYLFWADGKVFPLPKGDLSAGTWEDLTAFCVWIQEKAGPSASAGKISDRSE